MDRADRYLWTAGRLALAAILALTLLHPVPGGAAMVQPGEIPPRFEVTDLAGQRWSAAQLARDGKTVVLCFWALRCAPCLREMAFLDELDAKYRSQGLVILGVESNKTSAAGITEILEQLKNIELTPTYPIVPDPSGAMVGAFSVETVPTTFVIGPRGTVLSRFLDFSGDRKQELADTIEGIINPKKARAQAPSSTAAAPQESPAVTAATGEAPSITEREQNRTSAVNQQDEEFEKNRYFGDFYYNRQEFERALSYYAKCLEANPRSVYIHLKSGEVYAKLKQLTKARDEWEEVLRIQPDNAEANDNLRRLIRGDFQ